MERDGKQILAATAISFLLSIPLVFVPAVGPVAATWLGGRRAGRGAVVAGIAVSLIWALVITFASHMEASVGGTRVSLGPLALVAPVVCAGFLAGGLFASGARPAITTGIVLLAAGVIWSGHDLEPVVGLARQFQPAPRATARADASCPERLKKLYTAAMLYADSWDGRLPPGGRWEDALKETLADAAALRCPAVASGEHGYAMNRALSGAEAAKIARPSATVMFFDTRLPGPNATGTPADAPRPGRHGGRNYAVYADGHSAPLGD